MKSQGNRNFIESVGHCWDGIIYTIKKEINFKVEIVCAILAISLAYLLEFSSLELVLVLFCIGGVLALEIVNTSIERCVDLVTLEYHELAKAAKDTAAGAVLIFSIISFFIGVILYVPKLMVLFGL